MTAQRLTTPKWDVQVPTEEEVLSWFDELSNWGRWGPDDDLGTLNLITTDARRRGAASVKTGIGVSCSWDLKTARQPGELFNPMQRYMLSHGEGLSTGPRPGRRSSRFSGAVEFVGMVYHGWTITHLDTLAHSFWDGHLYNGVPAAAVNSREGASRYPVTVAKHGIVTRGILLDVAAARGVDRFECGQGVFPEDVAHAEERQGVRVQEGDALLLYTGFSRMKREAPIDPVLAGAPGPHAALVPWIRERGVSVFASDTGNDVSPSGYSDIFMDHPFHALTQVALGLWLIDNCDLAPLARACAIERRWEFLFSALPLPLEGGTGSPINPVAVL